MSRVVIVILIYHRQKPIDLINPDLLFIDEAIFASDSLSFGEGRKEILSVYDLDTILFAHFCVQRPQSAVSEKEWHKYCRIAQFTAVTRFAEMGRVLAWITS
jgi:hypothetical protein